MLAAPVSVITLCVCACAMCTSKPSFCWILTVLPLGIWSYSGCVKKYWRWTVDLIWSWKLLKLLSHVEPWTNTRMISERRTKAGIFATDCTSKSHKRQRKMMSSRVLYVLESRLMTADVLLLQREVNCYSIVLWLVLVCCFLLLLLNSLQAM